MFIRIFKKIMNIDTANTKSKLKSQADSIKQSVDVRTELWNDFDRRASIYGSIDHLPERDQHWLSSICYDGYVREQSLRWLINNYHKGDENRILLRLDDWVEPIRRIAQQWVLTRFNQLPFSVVKSNQKLLLCLSRKERVKDEPAWEQIINTTLAQVQRLDPAEFKTLNSLFRRFLYIESMKRNQALRSMILNDSDPVNRLMLITCPDLNLLTPEEKTSLQTDKSAQVRRQFIYWRLSQGETLTQEELLAHVMDQNPGIRDLARFYLKRDHDVDAYRLYREQSDDKFYYIADYNRREDFDLFLKGTRSSYKSTRQNCIRALINCAPERLRELDIPKLIRSNRHIRSMISEKIPKVLTVSEVLDLREAFQDSSPAGLIQFCNLLRQMSFPLFMDVSLQLVTQEDKKEHWLFLLECINNGRTPGMPGTPEIVQSIRDNLELLKKASNRYSLKDVQLVEFILK